MNRRSFLSCLMASGMGLGALLAGCVPPRNGGGYRGNYPPPPPPRDNYGRRGQDSPPPPPRDDRRGHEQRRDSRGSQGNGQRRPPEDGSRSYGSRSW